MKVRFASHGYPGGSGQAFPLIAFALATAPVFAAEQKIELKAAEMKGAKGEAVIKDASGGRKKTTVSVSGLKPNAVYTLWFVNEKPKMDMAGVGKPDYDFKSDATGNGAYRGTFPAAGLEKWEILEVAYHPGWQRQEHEKYTGRPQGQTQIAHT